MLIAFKSTIEGAEARDPSPVASEDKDDYLFTLLVIVKVLMALYTLVGLLVSLPGICAVLSGGRETSLNLKKISGKVDPV